VEVDTGPSVLTMPDVFDDLFRLAGSSLADEVELVHPDPAFRYVWPDGAVLDLHVSLEQTLASVGAALGATAAQELSDFLAYAGRIWAAAEPRFVRGPAPSPWAMMSASAVRDVWSIDPLRSMGSAIAARVRDPHLRDVLLRYATYAGSDPRVAPATLGCIAHVELALGGYGVSGGIGALVAALVRAATRLGVEVRLGTPVRRVVVGDGRVTGVVTDQGELPASVVVSNAEFAHLHADLLARGPAPRPTSTSGWNAIVRGPVTPRAAHTVLFPTDYPQEFVDLFDRARVPTDPTVYVCAQRASHHRAAWPDGTEPLFVMVNAPPTDRETDGWDALEQLVVARLAAAGLAAADAPVAWRRTPAGLAARFPGSLGALYGPAHDGMFAALRRPGNRVPGVRGLYVASGSAHPGGGLPLAALSGRAAVAAVLEDR
jgi:1-hydroxycarotenoid 3,4-desaturase